MPAQKVLDNTDAGFRDQRRYDDDGGFLELVNLGSLGLPLEVQLVCTQRAFNSDQRCFTADWNLSCNECIMLSKCRSCECIHSRLAARPRALLITIGLELVLLEPGIYTAQAKSMVIWFTNGNRPEWDS
jgi:hypothetical protein